MNIKQILVVFFHTVSTKEPKVNNSSFCFNLFVFYSVFLFSFFFFSLTPVLLTTDFDLLLYLCLKNVLQS